MPKIGVALKPLIQRLRYANIFIDVPMGGGLSVQEPGGLGNKFHP